MRFLSDLFRDPTRVIASIPASLRYVPRRALVLTMVNVTAEPDTHPARLVVRSVVTACDLTHCAKEVSAQVRGAAASIDASATLAVVVDDRLTDPDLGPTPPPAGARLLTELGNELATSPAPVIGAWATREIAAGSPWWTLNGRPERGVLTDPALSAVALERVVEGQSVHQSRQALRDTLAPDPTLTKLVEPLLPAAVSRAHHQRHRAVLHHDLTGYQRRGLETVLWRIADIAAGDTPTPAQLASLAVLMDERAVIDCLHTTAVSDAATAAEHLWTLLVRCLTGTVQAQAATLLAYSAYLRGDGPLAAIALDTALAANPRDSTALLLHAALTAGLAPHKLRKLADYGTRVAANLRIDMGEPMS
ncbi:DUF4192 family protein [Nocardia sp. R7R-8]|uniref:DUF4192 family protein n=1 Tax=Nocardia sp. R7R-8 TaxID=3459304 RepID=UPI00403E08A6